MKKIDMKNKYWFKYKIKNYKLYSIGFNFQKSIFLELFSIDCIIISEKKILKENIIC
jgi:hypothetical protein